MPEVYITHIASFLPNEPVDNDSMEAVLGIVGDRPSRARRLILRSNKIKSRHYAIDPESRKPTHTNSELAATAVRRMEDEEFSLSDINCLACGTSIADQLMPGHASMVHGELANPPCEVVSLSGVCVAGMAALKYAYLSVLSAESAVAVATASERASAMMRAERFQLAIEPSEEDLRAVPELAFEKDFLRWMLSDGAGAVVLKNRPREQGVSLRVEWIYERSYANELDACMYAGATKRDDGSLLSWLDCADNTENADNSSLNVTQDVKQLNEKIVDVTLARPLAELMDSKQLSAEDIDYFLPHYSSDFFRERVFECLQGMGFPIPFERWFTNLPNKGNTGSASIYIMLDELLHADSLKTGQKILCFVPESGRFSSAFMLLTVCDQSTD